MDSSPFMLLSRELRDMIYEYTFTSDYAVKLQTNQIQHPLTRTCVELRRETLDLYFSLTSFNAHLDDGPPTPLIKWMKTMGPEAVLRVKEINIWDMHMLNATLHGTAATNRLLARGTKYDGKPYDLKPTGYCSLNEIDFALREIGLAILRFCVLDDEAEEGVRVKLTSEFAVVSVEARIEGVGRETRVVR
ncbi:hypothetical protein PRZ48_002527 [Zasmidium cellare]|uniref:Uncharacterized protein n=1 Tax=Zasmidium cellare TaxID=395010 RepID=A0ABR0F5Z6_ZASCE|nr:hypothetical protein PRZ48_002527 [Zasmidium cellare]